MHELHGLLSPSRINNCIIFFPDNLTSDSPEKASKMISRNFSWKLTKSGIRCVIKYLQRKGVTHKVYHTDMLAKYVVFTALAILRKWTDESRSSRLKFWSSCNFTTKETIDHVPNKVTQYRQLNIDKIANDIRILRERHGNITRISMTEVSVWWVPCFWHLFKNASGWLHYAKTW